VTIRILLTLGSVHLGVLFSAAGMSKVLAPGSLRHQRLAQDVLPAFLSRIVGLVVPPLEIALGMCLLAGVEPRASAVAALVLLSCFAAYHVARHARDSGASTAPCGCLGPVDSEALEKSISVELSAIAVHILVASFVVVWATHHFVFSAAVSTTLGIVAGMVMAAIALRAGTERSPERHLRSLLRLQSP
jgi:uncharacterized membrane protein YphA (DoxX/SURF4 family)